MRKIGLEDLTFTEVYDKERMADGKKLAELGKTLTEIFSIERRQRTREIVERVASGDIEFQQTKSGSYYSSKYFLENPTSNHQF
jgi:hypothetical protein